MMNSLLLAGLLALGPAAAAAEQRIVGGEKVSDRNSPEYKHTVRLLVTLAFPKEAPVPPELQGRTFSARCSGSLISDRAVLTAAHCLPAEAYLPDYGGWLPVSVTTVRAFFKLNPKEDSPSGALHRNFVRHPGFSDRWWEKGDAWNPEKPVDDIAVVLLQDPAPSFKAPASPAAPSAKLAPGDALVLAGYGRAANSAEMDIPELRRVSVPFRAALKNGHDLYAGPGDYQNPALRPDPKGGCFGDSGAPAYLPGPGGYAVAGVIARGPDSAHGGCEAGVTVLTDVRRYAAWLQQAAGPSVAIAGPAVPAAR